MGRRRDRRRPRGAVDDRLQGILVLDKPAGITSQDAVTAVRRRLRLHKVGHGGTLDPMATGVLPLLINTATRAAPLLLRDRKAYAGVLRLGQTSDTLDRTGTILTDVPVEHLDEETILAACARFVGEIKQVPPMYSAVKIKGQKLYELARKNEVIERPPKDVTIHSLQVQSIEGRDVSFTVECSTGTYVRTLCDDIGAALGCGGLLAELRRTASGVFSIEDAVTIDEIDALAAQELVLVRGDLPPEERGPPFDARAHAERWQGWLGTSLLTLARALSHLPTLDSRAGWPQRLLTGSPLRHCDLAEVALPEGMAAGDSLLIIEPGRALAVAHLAVDPAGIAALAPEAPVLQPDRVFSSR